MKKLITGLVFSLLILMACVSPILADGASVVLDLTEMQRYEMADSLCWIDDSLYVLGNKGVYSWKSGSEKMNTVIDLAAASNYDYAQDCPEDESEATVLESDVAADFYGWRSALWTSSVQRHD